MLQTSKQVFVFKKLLSFPAIQQETMKQFKTKLNPDTVDTDESGLQFQKMQNQINILQQQVLSVHQMILQVNIAYGSLASSRAVLDVARLDKFYAKNNRSCLQSLDSYVLAQRRRTKRAEQTKSCD